LSKLRFSELKSDFYLHRKLDDGAFSPFTESTHFQQKPPITAAVFFLEDLDRFLKSAANLRDLIIFIFILCITGKF